MARIKSTGGHSWVQVLPGDDGYDDAIEATPMTVEGTDDQGRMFGGRSLAGVEDVNEEEAQVSTGITQFGLKPEGNQRGHADFVGYTGTDDSLGDPTGTPSTGTPSTGGTPGRTGAGGGQDSAAMRQLRSDYEGLSTQLQNLIADAKEKATADRESAYDTLYNLFVTELGLPDSLMDDVMEMLIKGDSDLAVTQKIRGTQEYKDRFPVMAQRADLKLPRLSEGTVLTMERKYRASMRQAGMEDPSLDYMTQWLVGDVSEAELQTRIALAETAVRTANTETKQQLKDLYNIDDSDLLNYYLDPDRATDIFEARLQLEAAGISAASVRGAGAALGLGAAERLQESGVQAREVEQRLGRRAGLLEDLIGSEGLAVDELAEGEFGTDLEAATELQRLAGERLSAFERRSGALTTSEGITGFGSAST